MSQLIHLGPRRAALALCVAFVALAAGHPGRALAGQIVYSAGTGIWAMNDDGSGKHELVDATQVPGMEYLGDPDVQPNGNEVAFTGRWNQSSVEQNKYYGASPGFCGGNCEGYYELRGGSVSRISPAPFDCGGQPCASYEYDPRVASDGSVGYVFQTWVSEANGYGWSPILGQSALLSRDSNGANQQQWKTACEGTSSANQEVTDANVLAVDPVNPNEIAYANCAETSYANYCDLGYVASYDVYLSGANRSDPSDDVLVRRVTDPNAECLRDATTNVQDLSFSPDGSHLVELHGSSGAGIWTYPAVANATPTQLISITGDWIIWSARYIGPNEIGFTAGEDANHDGTPDHIDLYEIPTSCTPQTCAIATGQGVTNLTRSGDLTYDYILNRSNFAWTSSTTPLVSVPTAGGPSGNGGTGGSAGGGSSAGSHGGNGGTATAPGATITVARTQRMAVLTKKGLTFTFTCTAACRAKATLILNGKTAVKLHLEKVRRHKKAKSLVVATVTKRLTKSGKLKVTIHLSRKLLSKLHRARSVSLTLKLLVTGSTGGGRVITKTLVIRR
ncbi:MAG TPA: hypothetical protein VJ741_12160 [Solirubrobacteraceae bacterium]|nr:hypothetical protein [Solirubrobacteraceae bacterium]